MKQLFLRALPLMLCGLLVAAPLAAQQTPEVPSAPPSEGSEPAATSASGPAQPRPIGDVVALGTISIGSLAAGVAMFIAAGATQSELEGVTGDLLYDQERRNTLEMRRGSQNVLGATFLGISALAGTGFGFLLARHLDERRGGAELTASPLFLRSGGGVQFEARF